MQFAHDHRRIIRAPFPPASSLLVVLALMWTSGANAVHAQAAAVAKIGIANPSRIFTEIQEKKDFVAKMQNDANAFQTEQKARAQKLKDQQTTRDMFKPNTPQYNDANEKLYDMTLELEFYVQSTQAKYLRQRKIQIMSLFDKITAAVGDVAKQKGLDIVIADVRPSIPPTDTQEFDQISENSLLGQLAQRNVLYNSASVDISTDVIAKMDADYKAGK